ncbi:uncharacterized protein LOC119724422 [Patiria miniata]|uniref:N-acetylneuraminate lyase n=1 Tax=Patiria miniata TaxID=46514 RepID=A0A913ZJ62_PATMI|nr:uncharacterized protein LOC119724422 [Patiria miniata]XP_038051399.1 uncharacterized protein LOC119724422 [Patiria miniata]
MEGEVHIATTEATENPQQRLPKTLTTIRTSRPVPTTQAASETIVAVQGTEQGHPEMEVTTEIIETLSEVLPSALRKTNTTIPDGGIPCDTILEVFDVSNNETTISQNEEQVAVTMVHTLSLPTSAENTEPQNEAERRQFFWDKIQTVLGSRNSDVLLADKVQRIKKVLQKEGKDVDEPSRFLFYIRQRQFSLKVAPELGWNEEVVCEPTKEEDASDDSLLGNWRRVAAAEEIYDIIKEIHERTVPHKNYRNTYNEVAKTYARIPRHLCKEFVFSCPSCLSKKDKNIIGLNDDGTPRRPLKRKTFSPVVPVRISKMSKFGKVSLEDFKLKGLIAAPFTPFEENGDLNTKLIGSYVNSLLQDGVDSVFVLGTTAEGPSLTMKERKAVASEWVKCGKGKLDNVVVQVGAGNLKDTQELAIHAAAVGVSAIAVLPPVYFKPQTPEHLVNYLKQVGAIVPSTPLFYYHYPMKTGVNFTMMDILRTLESDPIPNFKGAKFVTPDLTDFSLSVNVSKDKYQMIFSLEGMMLPSMTLGGTAFVGSTFSFAGKVFTRLIDAYNAGDLERARAEQFRMHAFLDVMNRYDKISGLGTLKYVMSLARFDVGPPRPPLSQMCPEDFEALRKDLTDIGFFDWIN